jgi:AmmeMemoRadiSam system protein B
MMRPHHRPALRPVESIVVADAKFGRMLVLRDTQGITSDQACIPPPLVPIVARFTGDRTCEQIAREVSEEIGEVVPIDLVLRLAEELERGLFLDGVRYREARERVEREFADAELRAASHAGGAYLSEPDDLAEYIDERCLRLASPQVHDRSRGERIVALVAPHIDPWRGAIAYGHAYGALRDTLSPRVDTFVLFGTSHAPMRQPFALCRKGFDTPLGAMSADLDALDRIAARSEFDVYADQFNHKREHSLEFQVLFLKHLLGDRPAKIIPILAGLGRHQVNGSDPSSDAEVRRFLDTVGEVVAEREAQTVIVAGADFAHVGPRFGDPLPYDAEQRSTLAAADHASLAQARTGDPRAFWQDVSRDLATRRVCGLAPIYSLLNVLPGESRGEVLHYEQTIDAQDGSIVSHAAVGFFR